MNEGSDDSPRTPSSEEDRTDSRNTVTYVIDLPGDTTIRPRPPHIPLDWPPEARRRFGAAPPDATPPGTPPA
jgi:hypothetical protein